MRHSLALLAVAWALVSGQQPAATVAGGIDRQQVTVGDRITFTVTVEHAGDRQVAWPPPMETLGAFEVLDHAVLAPVETAADRVRSEARYVLTAFEIGELEIPSIAIGWANEDDADDLTTAPMSVSVVSVEPEQAEDIRDIKPPLEMARNWWLLLPWIALAAALGALAYWLYRRYRNRAKPETAAPPVPVRPPHEVALEALDHLEACALLERGEVEPYFVEVSKIIRVYIEGRYGFVALEMTSRDIVTELERLRLHRSQVDLFEDFFRRSDLVKFAKDVPAIDRCKQVIPMARKLIDGSRERPVEPPPDSPTPPELGGGGNSGRTVAGVEAG